MSAENKSANKLRATTARKSYSQWSNIKQLDAVKRTTSAMNGTDEVVQDIQRLYVVQCIDTNSLCLDVLCVIIIGLQLTRFLWLLLLLLFFFGENNDDKITRWITKNMAMVNCLQ